MNEEWREWLLKRSKRKGKIAMVIFGVVIVLVVVIRILID